MYQFRRQYVSNSKPIQGRPQQTKRLNVYSVGQIVRITDLKPEPAAMDYHRRLAWLNANFVGSVVSSTPEMLILRNFRTGLNSYVHFALGYTTQVLTEEEWERFKACYPHFHSA